MTTTANMNTATAYLVPIILEFILGANAAATGRNTPAMLRAMVDAATTENLLAARENLFAAMDARPRDRRFIGLDNVYRRVEETLERRGIAPNADHYPADMDF